MEQLKTRIKAGKAREAAERVRELLDAGASPEAILNDGMIPAMDEVGDLFSRGEYFVPEMLIAARAMQKGLEVLKPRLVESGIEPIGHVLVGTVKGDLHDIGKNLLIMSLEGAGLEVTDLGTNVPPERFVSAVREHRPGVLGLSALLTTTLPAMKDTIQAIEGAGLRGGVKIMIGGAPVTQEFCDAIGADFYGADSPSGSRYARRVVTGGV